MSTSTGPTNDTQPRQQRTPDWVVNAAHDPGAEQSFRRQHLFTIENLVRDGDLDRAARRLTAAVDHAKDVYGSHHPQVLKLELQVFRLQQQHTGGVSDDPEKLLPLLGRIQASERHMDEKQYHQPELRRELARVKYETFGEMAVSLANAPLKDRDGNVTEFRVSEAQAWMPRVMKAVYDMGSLATPYDQARSFLICGRFSAASGKIGEADRFYDSGVRELLRQPRAGQDEMLEVAQALVEAARVKQHMEYLVPMGQLVVQAQQSLSGAVGPEHPLRIEHDLLRAALEMRIGHVQDGDLLFGNVRDNLAGRYPAGHPLRVRCCEEETTCRMQARSLEVARERAAQGATGNDAEAPRTAGTQKAYDPDLVPSIKRLEAELAAVPFAQTPGHFAAAATAAIGTQHVAVHDKEGVGAACKKVRELLEFGESAFPQGFPSLHDLRWGRTLAILIGRSNSDPFKAFERTYQGALATFGKGYPGLIPISSQAGQIATQLGATDEALVWQRRLAESVEHLAELRIPGLVRFVRREEGAASAQSDAQ